MNSNSGFKRWLAGGLALLCGMLTAARAASLSPWAPDSAVTPPLRFARSNDALCLSWKISPFSFSPVSRGSLQESNVTYWSVTNLTNQIVSDDEVRMMVPMTNAQGFFQLAKVGLLTGHANKGLFEFAVFGGMNLEMGFPSAATMTGPVHGNADIFLTPGAALTFQQRVTAAGEIYQTNAPGDPRLPASGTVNFPGGRAAHTTPMTFHIGESNSPVALRKIIETPPVGESPDSDLGKQRLYNRADLIVTVSDVGTTITSGIINNKGTTINLAAAPAAQRWLSTSLLYNRREAKTVQTIEINVGFLVNWNASTSNILPYRTGTSSRDVTIIHVDDQRTVSTASGKQSGVVLRNGLRLPPSGLTVVTPEPLYVHGDYNVKDIAPNAPLYGSHNTTRTKPAALMADAVTVLSKNWSLTDPGYGSKAFADRLAAHTTLNAAILAGIVETTPGQYSGGVENFPRFLEDWSGDTLTYNGSMVILFPSAIAKGLWQGAGSGIGIYNPPARDWALDENFRDPTKLPPGTPVVGVLAQPY